MAGKHRGRSQSYEKADRKHALPRQIRRRHRQGAALRGEFQRDRRGRFAQF